jgi:hypothetical protein
MATFAKISKTPKGVAYVNGTVELTDEQHAVLTAKKRADIRPVVVSLPPDIDTATQRLREENAIEADRVVVRYVAVDMTAKERTDRRTEKDARLVAKVLDIAARRLVVQYAIDAGKLPTDYPLPEWPA